MSDYASLVYDKEEEYAIRLIRTNPLNPLDKNPAHWAKYAGISLDLVILYGIILGNKKDDERDKVSSILLIPFLSLCGYYKFHEKEPEFRDVVSYIFIIMLN